MRAPLVIASLIGIVSAAGCACGEPDDEPDAGETETDAAPDASTEPEPALPAAPAPPEPVSLGPCPEGWSLSADEPAECLPWPVDAPAACEGASALLPGEADCTPIGLPCPAGDWADGLPDEGVIFVRPDGAPDAPGTREEPLGSVRAALALAGPGDTVAVAQGTWDEAVHVPADVTLRGACAAGTLLWVSTHSGGTVVDVTRGGVVVRDLAIGGAVVGVKVHGRLASARLESVLVQGATQIGIGVWDGAALQAEDVVVRDTAPDPDSLNNGRGISVETGGTVELRRVALEHNRENGAIVRDEGSELAMTDSVVRDTQVEQSNGDVGRGLEASGGALATLTRVVLERNRTSGIFAALEAVVQLEDVRVLDTSVGNTADVTTGLLVLWDAAITGERVVVRGSAETGVSAAEGGLVVLRDAIIRDTAPRPTDGLFGRALDVQGPSHVELDGALLEGNHEIAVFCGRPGAELVLTDTTIRGTRPQAADDTFGRGISTRDGVSLTADRLLVQDSFEAGVALVGTTATLRDLFVLGTQPRQADGVFGRGLVTQGGSHVTVERAVVEGNHEAGVAVLDEGATLVDLDLDVLDTASAPLGPGRGLSVQTGGSAELTRVRLQSSREVGLFASEPGSSVRGTDVLILDTLPRECAIELCNDFAAGIGVGAYAEAAVTLTSFRVERASLVGLQLARGGTIDLAVGVVSGCPIGANVQTDAFDAARLTDRVIYRDNERNFDGSELPLPL